MNGFATLNDVLATAELDRRPVRRRAVDAETGALRALVHDLARDPRSVPATLVGLARTLCRAGSAGLCIYERSADGGATFRWVAAAGDLAATAGRVDPRDPSPWGTSLDLAAAQLFVRPARHFTGLAGVEMEELLVVPWTTDTDALGTLWVAAHDAEHRFDLEDVRLLRDLAGVTAGVHDHLREARERERVVARVNQDLRNLLTVVVLDATMVVRAARRAGATTDDVLPWAEKTCARAEDAARLMGELLDLVATPSRPRASPPA